MLNSSDQSGGARDVVGQGDQLQEASWGDFSRESGRVRGIDVRSVRPGTELVVDTRASRYRLVIIDGDGSNALVQGGRYFRRETKARIDGSTLGGSLLKMGWIAVGLCVEISVRGQRIITSRIRSIRVEGVRS